ncbi:Phosphatidylinositol N-acetylglucosaminyltransferase subunit A [Sarcoptes scabiei]|uniref:Phosphatidylinositol N-acetylglucosaminyltransferase subunit A n=1 Tax=Sarcoptes scabiei TaxID=52283 RepID=A0A834R6C1_SARSC|nr:Phosphatidylinositol N-acetylglucosaminyltransferase subunit A [Sarcoptes scabiei]
MASDFFYPNIGGVESHIYQLAQCLLKKGHKVIVITHAYDDRRGIRYMTSGLKVIIYHSCFPIVRYILIRERIEIVHGHSAFSALAHEVMFHAKTLGLKTVFTDHSLFGFADASAIITNKLLKVMLSVCNRVICVSHTGKENTALRAGVSPNRIFVIPHPVDTDIFRPLSTSPDVISAKEFGPNEKLTIVVLSRLVYRKGIDLLAAVIPQICHQFPFVQFLIGGEGPKRITIEEIVERNSLQSRVKLLGHINPEKVRDVMVQGEIFLNCSLTEAFCIAIIEAAACGLQIISTKVGGIPEVLPEELIWFAEPSVEGIFKGISKAINDRIEGRIIAPKKAHDMVKSFYQWDDILSRILKVYDSVQSDPIETIDDRMRKFWNFDLATGIFFLFITVVCHFLYNFYSFFVPIESIDIAPEFDYNKLMSRNKNNENNSNENKE